MSNKILLDLDLFEMILKDELKRLTGESMKRFEIPFKTNPNKINFTKEEVENLKQQIKEYQYEWGREFYKKLKIGKLILDFSQSKEGDKNGK